MGEAVLQLEGIRRREFRRIFWVSVLGHLGLVAVFLVNGPRTQIAPPQGILAVDLVAPPGAAAQAALRAPAPAPAPPPPPVKKKVVLPKEPTPAASKPQPKAKPRPKPEPAPVAPPEAPPWSRT